MQKVLTAAQMREVDRLTTEQYGIPSIILMENAAHAVARVITEKLGGSVEGKYILILCGPGNNGGDGAAVGRQLDLSGAYVELLMFGELANAKGDAAINLKIFDQHVGLKEIHSREDWDEWLMSSRDWECVVDAIFGTGLSRPLEIWLQNVIRHVNILNEARGRLVISVDIPSGVDSDSGEPLGDAINAVTTVSFSAPKPGNVFAPAAALGGELRIESIGVPVGLLHQFDSDVLLSDATDAIEWMADTDFIDSSYKNKRGHALLIAGSKDYTGAAVLAGDAAMRSGVGLVTLAVPESSRESVVARVIPEVMVRGISETADGSASETAVDEVKEFLKNVDAVAIGSGLSSKDDETKEFVRRIVEERQSPVVIDADGLTALSPWAANGSAGGGAGGAPAVQSPLILTPHEGEFMRLLGTDDKATIKDRVAAVRDFAMKHHVILVLKGERVLIGEPGGKVVVNPTGNSGLGKAGNGDTLTGILVGFVAQAVQMKIDIFDTVVAAVYIAGMAGDIAEKKYGKRVMTASDVRECLVEVFSELSGD